MPQLRVLPGDGWEGAGEAIGGAIGGFAPNPMRDARAMQIAGQEAVASAQAQASELAAKKAELEALSTQLNAEQEQLVSVAAQLQVRVSGFGERLGLGLGLGIGRLSVEDWNGMQELWIE